MDMERSKDDDDEVQAQLSVYRGSNETAEHFYAKGMRDAVQSRRDDLPSVASLAGHLLLSNGEPPENGELIDKRDDLPSVTSLTSHLLSSEPDAT